MGGSFHFFRDFRSITFVLLLTIKIPCTDQKKKWSSKIKISTNTPRVKHLFFKIYFAHTHTKCSPYII